MSRQKGTSGTNGLPHLPKSFFHSFSMDNFNFFHNFCGMILKIENAKERKNGTCEICFDLFISSTFIPDRLWKEQQFTPPGSSQSIAVISQLKSLLFNS